MFLLGHGVGSNIHCATVAVGSQVTSCYVDVVAAAVDICGSHVCVWCKACSIFNASVIRV